MKSHRRCCALAALHGFLSALFDAPTPARYRLALRPFTGTPLPDVLRALRTVAAFGNRALAVDVDRFLAAALDAVEAHGLTWGDVLGCAGPCAHGAMSWSLAS